MKLTLAPKPLPRQAREARRCPESLPTASGGQARLAAIARRRGLLRAVAPIPGVDASAAF